MQKCLKFLAGQNLIVLTIFFMACLTIFFIKRISQYAFIVVKTDVIEFLPGILPYFPAREVIRQLLVHSPVNLNQVWDITVV